MLHPALRIDCVVLWTLTANSAAARTKANSVTISPTLSCMQLQFFRKVALKPNHNLLLERAFEIRFHDNVGLAPLFLVRTVDLRDAASTKCTSGKLKNRHSARYCNAAPINVTLYSKRRSGHGHYAVTTISLNGSTCPLNRHTSFKELHINSS
jgi:hypothetical protein